MSPRQEHRWFVDAIDEQVARVEVDGGAVVQLPRWLLPADAREGDVLRVRHARGGERSRLAIARDADATRDGRARSAAQVAALPVASDGGGDIAL